MLCWSSHFGRLFHPYFQLYTQGIPPYHHGDDREEIPVALDSGEAKRKHVSEEDHGWTKANSTQDLREKRSHEK